MTSRWHLVTGEYPPEVGGIGDFASVMAEALAESGADVHVWTPHACSSDARVTVRRLPDIFGRASRTTLTAAYDALPGRMVLHYTPNALGRRGANVGFCRWFAARARSGWDTRVFFHEPFLYFGRQSVRRNALAAVHRIMAALLLSGGEEVYLSTPSWQSLLERYTRAGHRWTWVPVTAGPLSVPDPREVERARARLNPRSTFAVGIFSTYARECLDVTRRAIAAILALCPDASIICMGRDSEAFVQSLPASERVLSTGVLRAADIGPSIAACDLMVQPYPEGVTFRRTSLLRCLSAGAAVVTTSGCRTEALWSSSGAVALAPADAPNEIARACRRLLDDSDARSHLAMRARETYERTFSPAAMLRTLDAVDVV